MIKDFFRGLIINCGALFATTQMLPGLSFNGGLKTMIIGGVAFMFINFTVVPLLKIMFLPLNILTFGFFTWLINVLALYFLTTFIPSFKLAPYTFSGLDLGMILVPQITFNTLQVAIIASLLIGLFANIAKWLVK